MSDALRAHDLGKHRPTGGRKYFTPTAALAAQRQQQNRRRKLERAQDKAHVAELGRQYAVPSVAPVTPMLRSVLPPPRGSVAFSLLYGWRR